MIFTQRCRKIQDQLNLHSLSEQGKDVANMKLGQESLMVAIVVSSEEASIFDYAAGGEVAHS